MRADEPSPPPITIVVAGSSARYSRATAATSGMTPAEPSTRMVSAGANAVADGWAAGDVKHARHTVDADSSARALRRRSNEGAAKISSGSPGAKRLLDYR